MHIAGLVLRCVPNQPQMQALYLGCGMTAKVKVKRSSRAALDCFSIATSCLELARRSTEDWEKDHHCITGITFTAFAIEAMFNHFGQIYFESWNSEKGVRKALHQKLFKVVNLPAYLGSSNYQIAKECFELRDQFAHGKTLDETVELVCSRDNVAEIVLNRGAAFRSANYERLENYINIAIEIEKDIQEAGFYPGQDHLPVEEREKLVECPLSVSGISFW